MTTEARVSTLETLVGELREDMREIKGRLDRIEDQASANHRTLLTTTITMWVTTMLGVLGTLSAVLVSLFVR